MLDGLLARDLWDEGEGILGRGLFDLCFRNDLCVLLGERDFFGVRLLLRERDLERDSFRQLLGLRERERDRGMCNLKTMKFILHKKLIYLHLEMF